MDGRHGQNLSASKGSWVAYGGAGDDMIYGGQGNDTIYADGGSDVISTGDGSDMVIVSRTGRLVTITDLSDTDTVDLSSWSPLGPVSVMQNGSDVIVTAALEQLLLKGTTVEKARARITGVIFNG